MGWVDPLAWCHFHQKWAFTKRAAKKVIRLKAYQGMRKYPCDQDFFGNWWHVGHLPGVTREGSLTAQEVYRWREKVRDEDPR